MVLNFKDYHCAQQHRKSNKNFNSTNKASYLGFIHFKSQNRMLNSEYEGLNRKNSPPPPYLTYPSPQPTYPTHIKPIPPLKQLSLLQPTFPPSTNMTYPCLTYPNYH